MSDHRDLTPLDEMAQAATKIAGYLSGVDRKSFLANAQLMDAVSLNLMVIGECARQVGEDTRRAAPEIDWATLRGLCNRIAHGYSKIDQRRVWDAIQANLPDLQAKLAALVEKLDAEP